MKFESVNPFDGKVVGSFNGHTDNEVLSILEKSIKQFLSWRRIPVKSRAGLIKNAGHILREHKEEYARTITQEMGKPITESRAEIEKCAWVCEYYAENATSFLSDEIIISDAKKSYVRHDPLGGVFAIMPWNFPFWQVFRFAAPTLTAGNVCILKHAPNVFGCSLKIEEVFRKAGFPDGVFQNLIIHHDAAEGIIAHDAIQAITLTGSARAGSAVATLAGKYLKKSVLELGGNNAFIVLADADMDAAVNTALTARMLNCGQSCIAAKRFIVVESVYHEFTSRFVQAVGQLKQGDPLDESTRVGPLARKDLADQLHRQVSESIHLGAELLLGGRQNGCFHEPTVLGNVRPGMPSFDEETFGPLASMIRAKDAEEAIRLSQNSPYGLGVTICTAQIEKAIELAGEISDGSLFINELVKSDPRLPFGGEKHSGYGRELAKDGMMEFINRKTVYIK